MPLSLSSPVTDVPRVGPAKAKLLAKLGILHARDFLYTFPRRYEDFSQVTLINQLKVGQKMTVRARVRTVKSEWGFQGRRRLLRIFVELEDESGVLAVTWYNLRFLVPQLTQGRELYVAGTVEENPRFKKVAGTPQYAMRSPALEFASTDRDPTHTARITPIYPETHGVTSRFLRYQVKQLLPLLERVPEYLPADIRKRQSLIGIHEAIREAHFPSSSSQREVAQRRLRFDELFFLQTTALVRRQQRAQKTAYAIPHDKKIYGSFIKTLPFSLTAGQEEALGEVASDLSRAVPMNRLLQGDVGSGKSVIAQAAAYATLQAGYTVVYLAPTEILARQQAESFAAALGSERVALLIGGMREKEKDVVKQRLASEEAVCVVGTHALLQSDVVLRRCALAIIDEQHRFGVGQRRVLLSRGDDTPVPHLLSMTATPIPRTLSLTVYGDLEVSVINELPPGRKPVKTTIVPPEQRDAAIVAVLQELHAGRQGYVISPLVEASETVQVKSAKATAEEMKKLFPDIAVGLLHGQLSSNEKEAVARQFAAGALQLLVATAVVEVGINVPNATVMIIEGAERFGLAQLHQFRGRIGRSEQQSYCYLFPTTIEGTRGRRLNILASTTDGFAIAEEDLQLRGPGEMYGVAQSGFGDLQVASLLDYAAIKQARQEAERLLKKDPELTAYPIIKKKVEQKNLHTHFE